MRKIIYRTVLLLDYLPRYGRRYYFNRFEDLVDETYQVEYSWEFSWRGFWGLSLLANFGLLWKAMDLLYPEGFEDDDSITGPAPVLEETN